MSEENNNSVIMETVDQNLVININNKRPDGFAMGRHREIFII